SSRRRHTRSTRDWSSDVCSSDLVPSALSVRTLGLAVRPLIRFAGGGAGTGAGTGAGAGSFPPSVPVAGRTSLPDAIAQANGPLPAPDEFQLQSTSWEVPALLATTVPAAFFTVTVHGKADVRRAWTRTAPPRTPL